MAPKRKGKEIESLGSGAGRKQAAVHNHGIEFKDTEQRDRYKYLIYRPISSCRCPDVNAMDRPCIEDYVKKLLNNLGLVKMLRPMWGFENFTYEFLNSLSFTKDKSKMDNPNHRVSFRLSNVDYEMSLEAFCQELGLANAGYIHDSWDQTLKPSDYEPVAFWKSITSFEQYNSRSNKASNRHNPVLQYIQRVMTCTIWGRKEVRTTRIDELFMLWAMLYNHPVNTCYYLVDYLVYVARKKPNEKSEIVVGGIITFIARKMGVGEERGITRIEGKNRLDIDTLTTMFFIRPYGPCHNYQYEWKINRAYGLIILPNPEVVENLIYVGTNPQIQDDGGNEEEEGAHLHDESVYHAEDVDEQFGDDRWT